MRLTYALILVLFSTFTFAQTQSFDNWFSTSISYDVNKKLTVSIEEGIRFSDFSTDLTYQDLTVKYVWSKYFRTNATWRFGGVGKTSAVDHLDHRFQVDLIGRYEIKPILFVLRARFQSKYRDMYTSELGLHPTNYMRTRLGVRYRELKKIEPEIGIEGYYSLNDPEGNYMSKYRLYAGIGFDIADNHEMEVNYIMQPEIQQSNPHTSHIVSVAYSFSLSGYLKDKKKAAKKQLKKDLQKINWYVYP